MPAHGTLRLTRERQLQLHAGGGLQRQPTASPTGRATAAALGVATVSITVTAVNDAPAAGDDSYSTDEDTLLVVAAPGVLGNDSDADQDSLTAILVTGPAHGSLTFNADGSFEYLPDTDFIGTDSFTYSVSDGVFESGIATVTLTVAAVNDAPVANPDVYGTDEDTTLTVEGPGVLGNDTDVDNATLTATLVSSTAHGTLTLNADGSLHLHAGR